MHACMYVCMTLHVCISMYVRRPTCIRARVRMYVCMYVCMYVSMYNICMIYLTSVFSQQSNVGPMLI